jgi:2-pyrone-4,6-dicarboxylate lactonase
MEAPIPVCEGPRPVIRRPRWTLPRGAIDSHFHIFGPETLYPYAEGRSYTPPDAPLADYERLCAEFGIERSVVVQPSPYGFDNTRTLRTMAESRLPMRAVLVLDPSISDAALAGHHEAGARGARFNLLFKAGAALASAERLADRVRGLGWHLQFLADVTTFGDLPALADRLRLPLVFDHLGHLPTREGVGARGFQDLLGLVRERRAWVKLSGAYRVTGRTHAPYDDARPFVDALIAAEPAQLVWGTDWPHPSIAVPMPDDTDLVDMFGEWVTDESLRRAILVANPERLYGFDAAS